MQWQTATLVGFPVGMRHNDCRLKKTAVRRLKAGVDQQVGLHTLSERERVIYVHQKHNASNCGHSVNVHTRERL